MVTTRGFSHYWARYQIYAASGLTFMTMVRYVAAGVMTVVGIPMYKNLGTNWALTTLGCISAAAAPVPYLLYYYGETVRGKSMLAIR
ncbi:hypothetical protein AG0111_0g9430 [Alternaria gaisen]|uniref:Uncharacterized protein n=1 Tax=Alternaria gaisen TaxID=167740 RepID=A0ACB6FD10_9PLEO|nr:hypothetical protein AG0111_0g9430 [Alternaria gaisen]